MRPANIVTAIADVLAGIAISGILLMTATASLIPDVLLLCISTIGLYGGGIVFNDVFDIKIDMIEMPVRVIPSGKISIWVATCFGIQLLIILMIYAFTSIYIPSSYSSLHADSSSHLHIWCIQYYYHLLL